MSLTTEQKTDIKNFLNDTIESKFELYRNEIIDSPFLSKLIDNKAEIQYHSFIHAIAASIDNYVFETISVLITRSNSEQCSRNCGVGANLSPEQKATISKIVFELKDVKREPNIEKESAEVLKASRWDATAQEENSIADFYMLKDGTQYFFEIKNEKPEIRDYKKSKIKLLEWIARKGHRIPTRVFLAFPFNPYYPKNFPFHKAKSFMDYPNDLLIGEEYWDLLGGEGTYQDLLNIFVELAKDFSTKINKKFSKF